MLVTFFKKNDSLTDDVLSGNATRREKGYQTLLIDRSTHTYVQGLVNSLSDRSVEVADILQECILNLDRAIADNKYDGKATVKTYYQKICFNYFQDLKGKRRIELASMPVGFAATDSSMDIEDLLSNQQKATAINQDILPQLTQKCQEYLIAYHEENTYIARVDNKKSQTYEKSLETFAQEKEVPYQTMKNNMSECRKALRKLLDAHPILQTVEF
ncbi:MAG: hypothetical protein RLZZ292_1673 [Bacteroidota bacterium]|jgi:RNA polymerase sigma factor (sigma-70 family)